jgi:hypothetical protein
MFAREQSEVKEAKTYDRSEKSTICVFSSLREFLAVSLFGDGDIFNFNFMIIVVFSEIRTKIAE